MIKLILLTYENRSGSTLLTKNLNSDKIFCFPESDELMSWILSPYDNKRFDLLKSETKFREWPFDQSELRLLDKAELSMVLSFIIQKFVFSFSKNCEFILFKGTDYLFANSDSITFLENFFQEIILIDLKRNPINIYNSQLKSIHSVTNLPMENNVVKFFNRIEKRAAFNVLFKKRIVLNFEEFILDVNSSISGIYEYLKVHEWTSIEYTIGKSQLHLHSRMVIDPSTKDLRYENINRFDLFLLRSFIQGRISTDTFWVRVYSCLRTFQFKLWVVGRFFS